jgi:hypothetical protein
MVKDMKEPLLPLFSIHLISVQFQHLLFVVNVVSYIPKGLVNIICNRFQNRGNVPSKSLLGNECLTSFITKHLSLKSRQFTNQNTHLPTPAITTEMITTED